MAFVGLSFGDLLLILKGDCSTARSPKSYKDILPYFGIEQTLKKDTELYLKP